MKTTKLITGQYTPSEAKEILLNMVDNKINFHKIKNLSSEIHSEKPDIESQKSIEELKEARKQIITLIQKAKDDNTNLKIESTISIDFETKVPSKEAYLKEEIF